MKFNVTVRNKDNSEDKRIMEATSRFAIYEQIEKEGATVVAIAEGSNLALPSWLNIKFGTGISADDVVLMTRNLGSMLHAGLTLSRSLSVVERQTRNKNLKAILTAVSFSVKKGSSFHEALSEYPKVFPKLFIAMSHAGEESGTLSQALALVGTQMERARNLTKKVRGAMIYPSIIIIAMIIIFVLMLMFVVPTLTNTFTQLGVKLPLATRVIVAVSDFLTGHTILFLMSVAVFVTSVWMFAHSKFGSRILFKGVMITPVIGELMRETYAARTARTLSSLLSSGVDMLDALSITREVVSTESFAVVIKEAENRVRKGDQLSEAFLEHEKIYPTMFSDMIEVGEETGQVADMLKQVADYYEEDVERRTKDLSTIIEPVLMLLIGSGVGVFAIAIIAPIYSLSSAI
ncbi:MAG TPA: type II secretion system F family protein [Candidatus Kaiserbacteria bacterium]|nr:type II secretion system F family protein [Candidatus Kaiserbacteria bacterium]